MPITVVCGCGKVYNTPDGSEGKTLVCPACGSRLTIPGAGPTIEPAPIRPRPMFWSEGLLIAIAWMSALGLAASIFVARRDPHDVGMAFQTFSICLTVALAGLAASRRG